MIQFVYDGVEIGFDAVTGDYIAKSWIGGNFYENKLLEKVKSLGITGTYVDIGAHHGNHSIFFDKFCNSDKVISIEGNPYNYSYLETNIHLNGCNNILHNLIVDKDNNKQLTMQYSNQNTGWSRVVNNSKSNNLITNKTVTLDKLLCDETDIKLIKLDIENYEYNALLGGIDIISKHKPIIIIELHKNNPYYSEIKKFLTKNGYTTDGINYAQSPTYIYKCNY